jgi:glycosyltransferase involved in cell wall biosynthesis
MTRAMDARVSIAMCTYNGARYIEAQLESIAGQTLVPLELVACDDQSTDDTVTLLERFAASAPFPVRVHVNAARLGLTANFSQAIALCSGDYIALCDQDDVWHVDKLARSVGVLEQDPGASLVFADATVVDTELSPLGYTFLQGARFGPYERRDIRSPRAFDLLLFRNFVMGATTVFRSRYRDCLLPIPPTFWRNHDGWIGLLLSALTPITFLDEPVMLYRQHADQVVGAPVLHRRIRAWHRYGLLRAVPVNGYLGPEDGLILLKSGLDRLTPSHAGAARASALLAARSRHTAWRNNLPVRVSERIPVIARELATLGYHRYSNGLLSAVKDLLHGAPGTEERSP